MPIVGGLDIHRKQLTFDYPGTVTGQVKRGQIAPADRAHLRAWLARFAGRDDVAFAMEGCTGWRYVTEELAAAGIAAHLGEPADTATARGRKRHAKTDKTDSRHLRTLLAEGRLPECWIPPAQILEYRALLETYHDLRREHTAQAQRIHAVFFHQGAPALAEGALRTGQGLAALRAAAVAHLSPAGQLQVATALEVLAAVEVRMEVLRTQLADAARHLTGAKVLAARLYGVGPVTALALTCWLAGAGRIGTVGPAVPGVQLRLGGDGELLLRGPTVMKGYRNDPARTAEAIGPGGWLHTGDIAAIDDDGYVTITGRKKELIINAAGKNMSPISIEGAVLAGSPLIAQAVAVGDRRPYIVALIVLDPEVAAAFAARHGITSPAPAVLADHPAVRAAVGAAVGAANTRLSRVEQIKRFAILPTFWEPGGDEITPTMKVKRRAVTVKYADVIESLYAAAGEPA